MAAVSAAVVTERGHAVRVQIPLHRRCEREPVAFGRQHLQQLPSPRHERA